LEQQAIIPFFGVKRQYENLREEILHITDTVLSTGQVLDGHYTTTFEQAIAGRCDRKYAFAVNSCTQGLIMSLQLVEPAGKVVIPAVSFAATVNSVMMTEHTPQFCDVDSSGLMDLNSLPVTLNDDSVSAVMYVNLYGNVIDYDKLKLHTGFFGKDPIIIEDAAQSFGASYKGKPSGKLGDLSVLSFDPTKNFNNYGSGGMILTDDPMLAESIADFRDNGKYNGHMWPGTNSKMSEVDCAQMLVKLNYFDEWQERRHAIATYYTQQLQGYVDIMGPGEGVEHAWHKFVLRHEDRGRLQHHLSIKGVGTKVHYDKALTDLEVSSRYVNLLPRHGHHFYNAEELCKSCLSLPIYPELTDSEVEHIAQSVKEYFW
jgi:dTDP-4-amino-4,6-dideoxygalactose transaminase